MPANEVEWGSEPSELGSGGRNVPTALAHPSWAWETWHSIGQWHVCFCLFGCQFGKLGFYGPSTTCLPLKKKRTMEPLKWIQIRNFASICNRAIPPTATNLLVKRCMPSRVNSEADRMMEGAFHLSNCSDWSVGRTPIFLSIKSLLASLCALLFKSALKPYVYVNSSLKQRAKDHTKPREQLKEFGIFRLFSPYGWHPPIPRHCHLSKLGLSWLES